MIFAPNALRNYSLGTEARRSGLIAEMAAQGLYRHQLEFSAEICIVKGRLSEGRL